MHRVSRFSDFRIDQPAVNPGSLRTEFIEQRLRFLLVGGVEDLG